VRAAGRLALAGVLVFAATTPLLFRGGQTDGDVPVFRSYGDLMTAGKVPYRDFHLEYPPGALPIFLLPAVAPEHAYLDVFRVLTSLGFVLGIVLVALLVTQLRAPPRLAWAAVLFFALTPALLGAFTLRRFDVWPADCCLGVLALLVARRPRLAFALLAVGVIVKTYPIVLLPLVVLASDRRARVPGLAIFCAIGLAALGPFAAIAHGGLFNSYAVQTNRPLHVDTIGASILLALHRPVRVFFEGGGWSIAGSGASVVQRLQTLVQVGGIVLATVFFARSRRTAWELVAATTAVLAAGAFLGKVLSPQYLLWVAPLVVLARSRVAVAAFTAAMLATNLLFPDRYFGLLHRHDAEIWLLVARNALLVATVVALLSAARPRATA
jgi:hypothetical protein